MNGEFMPNQYLDQLIDDAYKVVSIYDEDIDNSLNNARDNKTMSTLVQQIENLSNRLIKLENSNSNISQKESIYEDEEIHVLYETFIIKITDKIKKMSLEENFEKCIELKEKRNKFTELYNKLKTNKEGLNTFLNNLKIELNNI